MDLYTSTNGASWTHNTGWGGAAGTECSWYGVTCDAGQTTVQRLSLDSNNLAGPLPTTVSNLTNLQYLSLIGNLLTSSIPTQLGNLVNLQYINLFNNQLTGSIPAELGNLKNLQFLSLGPNRLTGSIPTTLGNLPNLQTLGLLSNQLSGVIPAELGNLTNLQILNLSSNQLTGSIPAQFGNLANLEALDLEYNQLSGSIPTQLGNLTNLRQLYLFGNQLTGSIPTQLGSLASLQELALDTNQLSGSIPAELGSLTKLNSLGLNYNQLSGSIPTQLGNLTNLQYLNLNSNQLGGVVPSSIANLTNLRAGYSDFRWNSLYSTDSTVVTFLNSKQKDGNWQSTQTVPVTGLAAGSPTVVSITLSWTPITYTGDTGGYEVFYSTTSGGPYTFSGMTANKSATAWTVTGLNPATNYYFIVKSVTNPNPNNLNTVVSDPTSEAFAFTLVAPPVIGKVFGAASMPFNGSTTLSFTIQNINTTTALTGISFSDTFPSGMVVAAPTGVTNNCGGTVTATAGSGSISLSGGTLAASAACTVLVNVTGTSSGVKNNTTGAVTSTDSGTGNTASASVTVLEQADLSITKGAWVTTGLAGSNVSYTVVVTNLGPTTATGVSWVDSLPSGETYVSVTNPAGWVCGVTAGVVQCTKAAAMAVNEAATFILTVTLNCGQADKTVINNTATVTFPGTDPVSANNTAMAVVTVSNPKPTLVPSSALYHSRGGTGSVTVGSTSSCPWNAVSNTAFLTITSGPSGTGAGPVNYTVDKNPGNTTLTGTLTIAGQTFTVTEIAANLDNSQTGLNVPGDGVANSSTPGAAQNVAIGYAQGQSELSKTGAHDAALALVYGTAVFSLRQDNAVVGETGVPAAVPTTVARLFIDYRPNLQAKSRELDAGLISINTGVAVVNPGGVTANLVFTLRDGAGVTLATGHAPLGAANHRALFIDQLSQWATDFAFPSNFGTATQFGTLTITSDQAVAVVALRSTFNQRAETLLTTTPTADLTKAPESGALDFPQVADGGAFRTTIILMNTTASLETGKINLYKNDGTALAVHRVGDAAGSAATFNYSIAAGGVYRLETDGAPTTINVGSAQVVPDSGTTSPVGAGVFRFTPTDSAAGSQVVVTESGVPAASPTTHALVYVDQSNGHLTGLAMAAPTSTPVHVSLRALQSDGVTVVGSGSSDLTGNGHDARFAQEYITGLPAGFTGVLEITAPTPVAVLTLRGLVNSRGEMLLTTFPVADFNQPAPGLLFPQIADGGGFLTQIILLNMGASLQYVEILYSDDNGLPLDVAK
ncbi:MAG: leucine-rich repeat domain-containing protein [Acidobacteriia bacterium]|nr:leucine-rich repeat domain-containing protein [Terriglobia bacterium]